MSWLRGEIEALRNFPKVPERFGQFLRPLKRIIRRKSKHEESEPVVSQEIPRVDEIIIPPNPFGSVQCTPSGMFDKKI